MRFWTDSVEAACAGVEGHSSSANPVAGELTRAIKKHRLSKALLLRVISSRERFLSDSQFANLDEMDVYGSDAFSRLNLLLLECLAKNKEEEKKNRGGHPRHAAEQLGMAQGLVTQLRATPYSLSRRQHQVTLPADLMAAQGLSNEVLLRYKPQAKEPLPEGLDLVVEAVAERAQSHLDNCRFRRQYLSREERLIMLPAVAVDTYLATLHKAKCNVFSAATQRNHAWLPALLYFHKWKRTY